MTKANRRPRAKPEKTPSWFYQQMWRVVDGAVMDAFNSHPGYLTEKGARGNVARRSIVKRVTGAVLSYAEQSVQGRSGQEPAADVDAVAVTASVLGISREMPERFVGTDDEPSIVQIGGLGSGGKAAPEPQPAE